MPSYVRLARILVYLSLLFGSAGCITLPASIKPLEMGASNICTTFAIHENHHLWLTAKHCVLLSLTQGIPLKIMNRDLTVIYMSPEPDDLAVLRADVSAEALPLAPHAPAQNEAIFIAGHPYGIPTLIITHGHLGARAVGIPGAFPSDILDITTAGGNSGSPVLTKHGVVGLLWGRSLTSEHAVSVPWETLVTLVGAYWDVDHL